MNRTVYLPTLISLFLITACNHKPQNIGNQQVIKRWKTYEDKAKLWSRTNSDSMLPYIAALNKEALKSGNLHWVARAYLLHGDYHSLKSKTDLCLNLYQKAFRIGDSLHDSVVIELSHNHLASHYLMLGQYDKAEKENKLGLLFAQNMHDSVKVAGYYNNLGNIAENNNKLKQAQDYLLKSIQITEKMKDTSTLAMSVRNLAYVMMKSDDTLTALTYFKKAIKLLTNSEYKDILATLYSDLGIFYRYSHPDSAIFYYNKALAIMKIVGDGDFIMATQFNLANLQFDIGAYKKAIEEFTDIYKKTVDRENIMGQTYCVFNIALSYDKMKNYAKAEEYFTLTEDLAKRLNKPDFDVEMFKALADYYKKTGNISRALSTYEQFSTLKDSLNKAESKSEIRELQARFDANHNEHEIVILKQESKIQQVKLQERFIFIISLIIFLIIVTSAWGIGYYYYRQRTIAYHKLMDQYRESLQAGIPVMPHHLETEQAAETKIENIGIKDDLEKLMIKEQVYLNPKLTIEEFSASLGIHRKTLSAFINTYYSMNFNQFLNFYRVEEAKRRLADPVHSRMKIEVIGQESGFNSKAAFYRSFQLFTGLLPTYFRDNI